MSKTPPPCDPSIFQNGTVVMMSHSIPSAKVETWVKSVARKSGQPVDWHFFGGRIRVLALGDLDKVREAIQKALPRFEKLQEKSVRAMFAENFDGLHPNGFKADYALY